VTLWANDRQIGEGVMPHSVAMLFTTYAGMDMGRDNGGVVDLSYADRRPFAFTGTVKRVVFDIKPHRTDEDEQAIHTVAHHAHAAHGISG
jgi:arylsulfatase